MMPEVGSVCRFTFTTKFSTLNGVYRVRAETTFLDALSSGVNFVNNLYDAVGLDGIAFNSDYASYRDSRVAVIELITDATRVFYVPETIFLNVPDPTINEYLPLILVTDLGVQKNPQMVMPLIDQITDLIRAALGSNEPVRLVTNPQNKVYLTDAEYASVETARAQRVTELVPLVVQLKNERDKNLLLASQLAAYEDLIRRLTAPATP